MRRFTLDTNVLWDAVDPKRPRHETAVKLLRLRSHKCEMHVATRLDTDVPKNPMRDLVNSLPIVASQTPLGGPVRVGFTRVGSSDVIADEDTNLVACSLRQTLFPGEGSNERRERARLSDIDHLIAHFRCGNDYFVTSDDGILAKKHDLAERFSIIVVRLDEALALAMKVDQEQPRR